MDPILAATLHLASTIRDSAEAGAWRSAWGTLLNIRTEPVDAPTTPLAALPAAVQLYRARWSQSGNTRPLMFPLVAAKFGANSPLTMREGLADQPAVWEAYQQMVGCLGLTNQLIQGLRSITPGYPHTLLLYSLPGSPWAEVSAGSEVPYNRRGGLTAARQSDPRFTHLKRVVPSVVESVQQALSALRVALRASAHWQTLAHTRRQIDQNPQRGVELERALRQIVRALPIELPPGSLLATRWPIIHAIEQRIYTSCDSQIQAYVQAFQDYEQLIERIYWVLTQIIIQQSITVLSSSDPQQIQQVHWSTDSIPTLTAMAPQEYQSLRIGQLVYLDLPETGYLLNGIYFVSQWELRYHVASGVKVYFCTRRLWEGALGELRLQLAPRAPIFVRGPDQPVPDIRTLRIGFGPHHEAENSFALGDRVIDWNISQGMYLP